MHKEDYLTERRAREKAATTMQEMRARIEALERDKREMRDMLNSQAASQFQREFAEVFLELELCILLCVIETFLFIGLIVSQRNFQITLFQADQLNCQYCCFALLMNFLCRMI